MSHLEGTNDFYEAGRKLAKHIAEHQGKNNFSTATLQALIRDMLPQHDEAQEALKSIVSRPDFLQLVKLSGSQKGFAQKTAFSESLSKIYNSEITAAADSLACGMLGLCAVPTTNDLEAQKIMTSTVSNKIEASEGNPPAIGDRNFEENSIRTIKELAAASISPAPPSHSAKKRFILIPAAIFTIAVICDRLTLKDPVIDVQAPYHVRRGAPMQIPNNTGISNALLEKAILASAKLQCKSELQGYAGWEAGIDNYRNFIEREGIGNRVVNSNTFQLLSASLKEVLVRSGSCEEYNETQSIGKVREWLFDANSVRPYR